MSFQSSAASLFYLWVMYYCEIMYDTRDFLPHDLARMIQRDNIWCYLSGQVIANLLLSMKFQMHLHFLLWHAI